MDNIRNRWLNLASASLLMAGSVVSGGIARGEAPRRTCAPDVYALSLSGPSATNCGTADGRADAEPVIKCLIEAQVRNRAARAKFVRAGIDSTVIDVFVRTGKGTSLVLHYDGDPWGGGGDGNPRLGQEKCARFERVDKYGPDVACVDGVALPVLCQRGR